MSHHLLAAAAFQAIPPEVQKYLEAVYAVAPVPEEYVKYRLHLATALPLQLLDCWFELRRQTPTGFLDSVLNPKASNGPEVGVQQPAGLATNGRPNGAGFSLFGPPAQPGIGLPKALPARESLQEALRPVRTSTLPSNGPRSGNPESRASRAPARHVAGAYDSGSGDDSPSQSSRFTEADLQAISSLVGLETLTSTQEHCGSTSLFMFEQLTALDSLDTEGHGKLKRKRTRHQHFWRNTDKLDSRDRVYIPTSSIKPALRRNQPVESKPEISPEERTNAWTVCLTTRGVVSYLNKRISPLGVQLIRALQNGAQEKQPPKSPSRSAFQGNGSSAFQGNGKVVPRGAEQPVAPARELARTQARDEPSNQVSRPGSSETTESDTSGSQGVGQKRKADQQPAHLHDGGDHLPALPNQQPHPSTAEEKPTELIPRIRRRKPA